jgi:hypothetical protein
MTEEETLHFVSIGGGIEGHETQAYEEFHQMVQSSPYRERYHLLGWVPTGDVAGYFAVADVGVNADRDIIEVYLGSKARVATWLAAGLPPITSSASQLAGEIAEHKLGWLYPPGDYGAFAEVLLEAVAERSGLKKMEERARAYAREHLSYRTTCRPLIQWALHPRRASDAGTASSFEDRTRGDVPLSPSEREQLESYRGYVRNLEGALKENQDVAVSRGEEIMRMAEAIEALKRQLAAVEGLLPVRIHRKLFRGKGKA